MLVVLEPASHVPEPMTSVDSSRLSAAVAEPLMYRALALTSLATVNTNLSVWVLIAPTSEAVRPVT